MYEKLIPYDAAHLILGAYISYYHKFKRITKRAKIQFELGDWHGIQASSKERLSLYRESVGKTTEELQTFLGENTADQHIWQQTKQMYFEDIMNFNTRNIAETFYNSVFRHSHKGLSSDTELMFVHSTGTYREFKSTQPIYHTFFLSPGIEGIIYQLLLCYPFDVKFADKERDIRYVSLTLQKWLEAQNSDVRNMRIEVLKSLFFRNKASYIVGRVVCGDKITPFVIPILNRKEGISLDTLLLETNEVSSIFSYHRSYFLVDVDIVSETVDFLCTILPTKGMGEIYNSIGFEKHGKTVFYRDFLRHLAKSSDLFVRAPGIEGMVMSVFTLPSYNVVFKIIKDRFAPPKRMNENQVKKAYSLVHEHDRVGRMTDFHLFENLVFDKSRFSSELLEDLQNKIGSKLLITDDTVEIQHLYIEKKMEPLNLYLERVGKQEAIEAINEYGKAIKQLAAANIFPGDMLLKNFGVTRLKRVVFYDYDEIGFLTDYNFRTIPEPQNEYQEMASEPWYHVAPNDIFPEEFPNFLISEGELKAHLLQNHSKLFTPVFWKEKQEQLKNGEIIDVFPYRRRLRFINRYPDK
ncbi:MAG: isocitrate dehydrogenase kinase/phosphatase [Saprospiraceae bacterium]|jgi:isocitrate dehydrogenase kinase/phosphatase